MLSGSFLRLFIEFTDLHDFLNEFHLYDTDRKEQQALVLLVLCYRCRFTGIVLRVLYVGVVLTVSL